MATSSNLITTEKTVGWLIVFIATPSVTSSAIKDFFAPYCDCQLADWIVEAIDNDNMPVINKLKELLAADPLNLLNVVIRDKPAGKLVQRFCEGGDLKSTTWTEQGVLSTNTLVQDDPRCFVAPPGIYIRDSLQFNDSMSQPLEGRNLEIGDNFWPRPANPDVDPDNFKNYIFNVDGLGIIESLSPDDISGSWFEGWAQNVLYPNKTPIPSVNIDMGFSVNVTQVNGRGDWPGLIAIGLGSELDIRAAANGNEEEWPFYKWDTENPIQSYYMGPNTGLQIGLVFNTYYDESAPDPMEMYQSLSILGPIPHGDSGQFLAGISAEEYDDMWESNLSSAEKQGYSTNQTSPGFPAGNDCKWFRKYWYDEDDNIKGYRMDFRVITYNNNLYVYLNDIRIFEYTGYRNPSKPIPTYGYRCAMGGTTSVGGDKRRLDNTELKDFNLFDYYVKSFDGTPP